MSDCDNAANTCFFETYASLVDDVICPEWEAQGQENYKGVMYLFGSYNVEVYIICGIAYTNI